MTNTYTDNDLIEAVKNVTSYSLLCKYLCITNRGGNISTLKKKVISLNIDTTHFKYRNYTDDNIINIIPDVKSYSELMRKLGLEPKGGNLTRIIKKVQYLGLDTSHFLGQRWNKGLTFLTNKSIKAKPIEELLVEHNVSNTTTSIKNRILKEGLKLYKCECCGNTEWMNLKIPLLLHHINGNPYDMRILNLQLLCPNCHALTDNFAGKANKPKK